MKLRILSKIFRAAKWRLNARAYQLQLMETFADRYGIKHTTLLDRSVISGPQPKFFGGIDSVDLTLYEGQQVAPRVTLTEFENVTAIGRSELVLHGSNALYPSPFDPALYAFMLEGEKRARVNLKRGRVKMLFRSKTRKVDTAISLLGQCNGNYAHWILEVLTRLAIINTLPELKGLPLLVDSPIHEKMMDALDVLNATGREVIPVRDAERVKLKRLFSVTSPSFTHQKPANFLPLVKSRLLIETNSSFRLMLLRFSAISPFPNARSTWHRNRHRLSQSLAVLNLSIHGLCSCSDAKEQQATAGIYPMKQLLRGNCASKRSMLLIPMRCRSKSRLWPSKMQR